MVQQSRRWGGRACGGPSRPAATRWSPRRTSSTPRPSCAIATGIAQIHARHPHTARAGQRTLHEASGGRFLLGLGVSHAPFIVGSRKLEYRTPYSDMVAYLAAMAEAPFTAVAAADEPPTVLAALGPKMLRLAAPRRGSAPVLLPGRAHRVRPRDAGRGPAAGARADGGARHRPQSGPDIAVKVMSRYLQLPNYTNNLLRHGFGEDDVSPSRPERPPDRRDRRARHRRRRRDPGTAASRRRAPTTCASSCSAPPPATSRRAPRPTSRAPSTSDDDRCRPWRS